MATSRHSARSARFARLTLFAAAGLAAIAAHSGAPAPARASTPAAWEELRLRAVQTCTAELLSRNLNVLAVERIDSSGATYTPTSDGLRVRLRVQRPGQPSRTLLCSYRRPEFSPPP